MFKKVALAALMAAVVSTGAQAGQLASGNFTVQATIAGSCTAVTPQSLFDFGLRPNGTSADFDSTMTVDVTCTASLPYNLAVSKGQGNDDVFRTMKNGTNSLTYYLFTDSGRLNNLSSPTGGSSNWIGGVGTGSSQTLTIYGRIPTQPTPVAGVYTDTLQATVIW